MIHFDYEKSRALIVEGVRRLYESEGDSSKARGDRKKRLNNLAGELERVSRLMSDVNTYGLQMALNEAAGTPYYQDTIIRLLTIAANAEQLAEQMPNTRFRFHMRFAAGALLRLIYLTGKEWPTKYVNCEAVLELERITQDAKVQKSRETCFHYMQQAMQDFDPDSIEFDFYLSKNQ